MTEIYTAIGQAVIAGIIGLAVWAVLVGAYCGVRRLTSKR